VDDPRPVTHCLLAVAPLFVAAHLARPGPAKDALAGAGAGALAHFARDLAVGTGVALLQPLSGRHFKIPDPLYLGALVALAAWAVSNPCRKTPAIASKALRFPSAYSRSRPFQSRAGTYSRRLGTGSVMAVQAR
jgi:hypothetical protein